MGIGCREMKCEYFSLAATNFMVQATRDPLSFVAKTAMRLTGRPVRVKNYHGSRFATRDWDLPIAASQSGSFNGNVLHVLTNSLPHSSGGYAIRSHNILVAQKMMGLSASAITRLGYPISVGKIPDKAVECIGGVTYKRSLPRFFPYRLRKQVEVQARCIAAEARRSNASVLHTTTPWTNALATSLAAEWLSIPWVYEVRGEPESTWASQSQSKNPESSVFYRASRMKELEAMNAAAAVVTLSQTSAESLRQRGVAGQIVVAPNAIDPAWAGKKISTAEARRILGLDDRRYAGAISSIVGYEGFEDLIVALHQLPEDVAVLLVGDGTALAGLRELVRKENLEARVVFAGKQPQDSISLWYSALDVFVIPRKDLPVTRTVTPIKTLQAQAFGIPIVASDLPALREVTRGAALYVAPENPQELADAVSRAFDMRQMLTAKLPTWTEISQIYLELYQRL